MLYFLGQINDTPCIEKGIEMTKNEMTYEECLALSKERMGLFGYSPSKIEAAAKAWYEELRTVKVGDKLTFNYGGRFPTEVGTVTHIVSSRYSKGGAFAQVELSREFDGVGNSFAKITTADIDDIKFPGETTVNGSSIGVFLTT